MFEFNVGDLVQGNGISSGARYEGKVVNRATKYSEVRIEITRNISKERGTEAGSDPGRQASITNVQKVETVSNELIGPKPEAPAEPKFPTPWRRSGRTIVDANSRTVLRIAQYPEGGFQGTPIDTQDAFNLAGLIVEAVNEKYGKAEDSKSPF